jgi:hypothetical protein
VARAATEATLQAPDKIARQGAKRWLLQKATPGVGSKGQGVTRVVLEEMGSDTAALVTSHPASFIKALAAMGIGLDWLTDPFHSAEAAGPDMEEEWINDQRANDPGRFSQFLYAGTSRATTDGGATRDAFPGHIPQPDFGAGSVTVSTCIENVGDPPCPH